MVNHFCRNFLFPQYKFLKDGWKEYLPDKKKSLYLLCMCHLMILEGYLGEGHCTFDHEKIPEHEMQPQQQHQINIHEYDDVFMILCFCGSCELH
jgi:hypothetical protein